MSTTHTITGAVIGVGTTNRFSAVHWGLTGRVMYAWLLTLPGAAAIAAISYVIFTVVPAQGAATVGLVAAASIGILSIARKRHEAVLYAPP